MQDMTQAQQEGANLAAKFKKLKDEAGITKAEFARRYKVPGGPSMISQHISGHRPIGLEHANAYMLGFGCTIEDISPSLASRLPSSRLPPAGVTHEPSNVTPAPIGTRLVPLISYVQAGYWTEATDPATVGDGFEYLLTDLELSGSAFALQIEGESMLPQFRPGDRVIVDPEICPQPGDFVVAMNGGHEATFKKYRPRSMDEAGNVVFELVPLNEDFAPMRSDQTPIRIVGTMMEHRQYRRRG